MTPPTGIGGVPVVERGNIISWFERMPWEKATHIALPQARAVAVEAVVEAARDVSFVEDDWALTALRNALDRLDATEFAS